MQIAKKHAPLGGATQKQRDELRKKIAHNRAENDRSLRRDLFARPDRRTGVYAKEGLPPLSSAPVGARVVDCIGSYAVALVYHGFFIGLFLKDA